MNMFFAIFLTSKLLLMNSNCFRGKTIKCIYYTTQELLVYYNVYRYLFFINSRKTTASQLILHHRRTLQTNPLDLLLTRSTQSLRFSRLLKSKVINSYASYLFKYPRVNYRFVLALI